MTISKLEAGGDFPAMNIAKIGGGDITLGKAKAPNDWQMIIVYRGKHCPLCTRYLDQLNTLKPELDRLGVEAVAISADSEEYAIAQTGDINPDYAVGHSLSIEQMQQLGLYISEPRSPEETDHIFAEPGLFVVNEHGKIQIIDISNAPFARPDLQSMIMGLGFIRNPANNYPIRGTYG